MLDKFYSKADGYLSLVDDSMNDFTKALVLHDAIVMNSEYFIKKDGVNGTPYTLMVEGWGKCEDYSRAYAYLLAQAGIKSFPPRRARTSRAEFLTSTSSSATAPSRTTRATT